MHVDDGTRLHAGLQHHSLKRTGISGQPAAGSMPGNLRPMRDPFASLPDAAVHRIFQLVCGSCPPEAPGICQLVPVCKRWQHLSCGVKGLRVLFHKDTEQQVGSFCAWLRRYAGQVKVLAITSPESAAVLAALAQAAAAATAAAREEATAVAGSADAKPPPPSQAVAVTLAGGALPLQRLVVTTGALLRPFVYEASLRPLLGALPGLQHLHLYLIDPADLDEETSSSLASMTVGLLSRPLQQCTSLTSLVLDGPKCRGDFLVDLAAQGELASRLPSSLRSLTWELEVEDPGHLSFDHLTALTHLHLSRGVMGGSLADDAFSALHQLRRLELHDVPISEEGLLACKEQLVALAPDWDVAHVLAQLTQLQSFTLGLGAPLKQYLLEAPQLEELCVQLPGEEDPPEAAWATPWALQHYSGLTGLQRLSLAVASTQAAPLGLCLMTQLKQLAICAEECDMLPAAGASWAMAVAGLVNLEVLCVPAALTTSWHPWLTRLTRLVVLEVCSANLAAADIGTAASHISRLLAVGVDSSSSSRSSSSSTTSSSTAGVSRQVELVRMVCFGALWDIWQAVQLHRAVAAAVPVLPPSKHLFLGSWQRLQECGVELWPEAVAARLQQLQPSVHGCAVVQG